MHGMQFRHYHKTTGRSQRNLSISEELLQQFTDACTKYKVRTAEGNLFCCSTNHLKWLSYYCSVSHHHSCLRLCNDLSVVSLSYFSSVHICCRVYSLHLTESVEMKVITDMMHAADGGEVSLLCMSAAFEHDKLTQMTTRYWLVICSNCSGSREWLFPRSSPFCRTKPSLSALMGCSRPDHYWPVASHKEAFSDLCFSLSIVSVLTSLQSPNDVVLNCTHMRTTLRCFHADRTTVDSKMQQLVACDGEIGQWMCANRLKLNKV